jgi:hypothetical protein
MTLMIPSRTIRETASSMPMTPRMIAPARTRSQFCSEEEAGEDIADC